MILNCTVLKEVVIQVVCKQTQCSLLASMQISMFIDYTDILLGGMITASDPWHLGFLLAQAI